MSLAKHVIHQPKPHRKVVLVIIVVAITYAVQWFFNQEHFAQQQKEIEQLTAEISRLQKHNQQFTVTSEQHYSQLSLEQATTGQLRKELTQLQEQVLTLNKELSFYQSITQGTSSSKLQIRELHLRADNNQVDLIRYRLVISQGRKINKPITGTISLMLNNDNNGTIEQHALESQQLNLRHVQVIEGQIDLANITKPTTLTIDLIQNKKITLSQTFDWKLTPTN